MDILKKQRTVIKATLTIFANRIDADGESDIAILELSLALNMPLHEKYDAVESEIKVLPDCDDDQEALSAVQPTERNSF